MADETGISWTDHTHNEWLNLCLMYSLVASLAKSYPVAYIKAKVCMIGIGFDMMRAKISTLIIAATHAGKIIPCKNIVPPLFVLRAKSISTPNFNHSILL